MNAAAVPNRQDRRIRRQAAPRQTFQPRRSGAPVAPARTPRRCRAVVNPQRPDTNRRSPPSPQPFARRPRGSTARSTTITLRTISQGRCRQQESHVSTSRQRSGRGDTRRAWSRRWRDRARLSRTAGRRITSGAASARPITARVRLHEPAGVALEVREDVRDLEEVLRGSVSGCDRRSAHFPLQDGEQREAWGEAGRMLSESACGVRLQAGLERRDRSRSG